MTSYKKLAYHLAPNLKYFIRWIFACVLIIPIYVSANTAEDDTGQDESFINITDSVPEGFEDLAGPQVNHIDVYYQGRFLVSTEATYDFESVKFHNPEIIINNIDYLIDPSFILKSINRPLSTNSDLVCQDNSAYSECEKIKPNIAGIIFDESRFRVDLYINPNYIEHQYVESSKYLPDAEDKFSTIHNFSFNLSGTDAIDDTFNAQTNSVIAYGDTRLLTQSNYTDEEDFVIDEISMQKDFKGWEAEAGVFESESRSTNFFSQVDLTGLRVQTSLNTRTDIEKTSGTEIFIFLDFRSRVEVFRNNRLIDARFYEAGNQQLDTYNFPDGAYQIRVRIREENGSERTEEYFFIRNALLPPINEPVLYAEVGKINKLVQDSTLPETSDDEIVHFGASVRTSENLAIEGEVLHANSQTMFQTGVVHVLSGAQSQLNIMTTTESDWGVSVRENISRESFTLNADFRYIHQGDDKEYDLDEFDLVSSDSTQATASLSHMFMDGRVVWRYRHLDLSGRAKSETYSLDYRRQILRRKNYQVDWELSASKDIDDYLIGTRFKFSYRNKNNLYRADAGVERSRFNGSKESDFTSNVRWQNSQRSPKFGSVQSQLFHITERDRDTFGANIISESRIGSNQLEINRTSSNGENTFGYSLGSRLSVASDFKTASLGGARQSNSAIIIDLKGEDKGEKFEVFVDDQPVGYASVGSTTIIPLSPYQTYEVKLASRSDTFFIFDERTRETTLYPGNVNTMSWDVSRVLIFIGRAIDENGEPVQHAKINNDGAFSGTDERGWFQIESKARDELILKRKDGSHCKIDLGNYDNLEDIHVFDELICKEVKATFTGL